MTKIMNLISCNNCGVVLDQDLLSFPDIYNENLEIIEEKAMWNGDQFVPKINCPVCKEEIGQEF